MLFERLSLDLMGKRRVGRERGSEIGGGGAGVAGL